MILAPATPYTAPKLGQETIEVDGEVLPVRPNLGVYTQPISCIGLPVLAVPVPRDGQLPIGVQLIAAPGREDILFRVADALERSGVVRSPNRASREGRRDAGDQPARDRGRGRPPRSSATSGPWSATTWPC